MGQSSTNEDLQRFFDADGFAALPQFVEGEKLYELIANVDRFLRDIVPTMPQDQVFFEDKEDAATLKQIQHMEVHDAWFREQFTAGRFRALAELLLDGPVVPKNLQYFNKPPGVGRPTPAHQDGYYFMLDPCEAVTMWFALEDVDEENGCVRYVRGSHESGMREHSQTQTLGFSQGIVDFPTAADRADQIAMPVGPGDLLVHDGMTVHWADGNQSPTRSRRALGFIYYSTRAREDTEAHAAYQRKLAATMQAAGRI